MNEFKKFMKKLREYESDTFSAKGAKLTKIESEEIAGRILFELTDAYVDGLRIAQHLLEIRGVEEEEDLYG